MTGFDHDGPLTGGIQTTGNYPGRARTPEELFENMDQALRLMPGKKKINVHACYAILKTVNLQTVISWSRSTFRNG